MTETIRSDFRDFSNGFSGPPFHRFGRAGNRRRDHVYRTDLDAIRTGWRGPFPTFNENSFTQLDCGAQPSAKRGSIHRWSSRMGCRTHSIGAQEWYVAGEV